MFRAGVNAVRVDVIVTDKSGNPVNDLTAAGFEVQEDGKPQEVDLFKLVNSDGNVAPGGEPPRPIRSDSDQEFEAARDDVRLFVIFLVDYTIDTLKLGYYDCITDGLINDIGAKKIARGCRKALKTWGTGDLVAKILDGGRLNPSPIPTTIPKTES